MMQWVTETLQSASMGPAAVPLALLLGLVSAVASACCTLPAMGMLVAYSGTREDVNRRTAFASAISFMAGTTLALIVLGFVAGFVGQAAQALLGRYWKVFAGLIAIVYRFIDTGTYYSGTCSASNFRQRCTTGATLISVIPLRMRSFNSSQEATRIPRRNVRAIFPNRVSTRLSHEP